MVFRHAAWQRSRFIQYRNALVNGFPQDLRLKTPDFSGIFSRESLKFAQAKPWEPARLLPMVGGPIEARSLDEISNALILAFNKPSGSLQIVRFFATRFGVQLCYQGESNFD
jgi:hypothetical protein